MNNVIWSKGIKLKYGSNIIITVIANPDDNRDDDIRRTKIQLKNTEPQTIKKPIDEILGFMWSFKITFILYLFLKRTIKSTFKTVNTIFFLDC